VSADDFYRTEPTPATSWRMAILLGRNERTYKFALGAALLDLAAEGREDISLVELATLYTLKQAERSSDVAQAPSSKNTSPTDFVTMLHEDIEYVSTHGEPTQRLVDKAVKDMPGMVMTKFPNANGGIDHEFYRASGRGGARRIVLTPHLHRLAEVADSLSGELESRWSIVESAFAAGVSNRLVGLRPSADGEEFVMPLRRVAVSSALHALKGFQHGRCFYCHELLVDEPGAAHVDHVFPWSLMNRYSAHDAGLDGVWNLVAACASCNLAKSNRMPRVEVLTALVLRNETVLASPEPLKVGLRESMETALAGSSTTVESRRGLVRAVQSRFA
jgi:hypothetical protein